MQKSIQKLIEISSQPLGVFQGSVKFTETDEIFKELVEILKRHNGFYCFEFALHFFPYGESDLITIEEWNSDNLWKSYYGNIVDGLYFFAEDIFGNQFCISKGGICFFDAETGNTDAIADNFSEWSELIFRKYNYWTGYSIAHDWQEENGSLKADSRLIPKLPFICNGQYSIDNLHSIESYKGMRYRGEIATQIKDLPDGAEIKIEFPKI